jgi:hypothetical protein
MDGKMLMVKVYEVVYVPCIRPSAFDAGPVHKILEDAMGLNMMDSLSRVAEASDIWSKIS